MPWCCDAYEPECGGSWCEKWGFCEFSLQSMLEDSSLRKEWSEELRAKGKMITQEATTAWRRFLRKERRKCK